MSVLTGTSQGRAWSPREPLTGHRHGETWLIDVLDADDQIIGTLDGVTGGSLDFSIHTEIRSSGTLTVTDPSRVDWHRVRLAIRYEYLDATGQRHSHPLGVFLPTTPGTRHSDVGASADVDLYDKMSLLSTDAAASTWSVDAGTTVVDAVTEVLASVGESRIVGPDDGGGALTAPMVWEPGTTKLRIVNDVLDAGNFFSLWVDGEGVWQLQPYTAPTARGVAWEHVSGAGAIFEAEFEHEADGWAIPNVVVIVGKPERDEDGDELPPAVGVARNDRPDDPFSTVGRGRDIVVTEEDQDATSEAVLGQIAARRLLELSSVTSTYEISHAWLPVDLNAAVRLRVPERDIDALCVLQAWSWSWSTDGVPGLVSSTLREVQE